MYEEPYDLHPDLLASTRRVLSATFVLDVALAQGDARGMIEQFEADLVNDEERFGPFELEVIVADAAPKIVLPLGLVVEPHPWPSIDPGAVGAMGRAVHTALDHMEARHRERIHAGIHAFPPAIILCWDGRPTDESASAIERLQVLAESRKMSCIVIASRDADPSDLEELRDRGFWVVRGFDARVSELFWVGGGSATVPPESTWIFQARDTWDLPI